MAEVDGARAISSGVNTVTSYAVPRERHHAAHGVMSVEDSIEVAIKLQRSLAETAAVALRNGDHRQDAECLRSVYREH